MNFYERHLGDYAKDTGHLSLLEHGVYTVLLDRYYSTEAGIPADKVYRFARARSPEEMAAVDAVLDEFFTLSEGVWINQRAYEEIEKAHARINAARDNGKKGGRPSKEKPNPFETETQQKPSPFENETQQKAHHTPYTRHHTPEENQHTLTVFPSTEDARDVETAGRVCLEFRRLGIAQTNPQHANLLQLIRDGTTLEDFISAGSIAVENGKGFAYALGVAKSQQAEKNNGKPHATRKHTGGTSRLEHSKRIGAHLDKLIAEEFGPEVDIGAV